MKLCSLICFLLFFKSQKLDNLKTDISKLSDKRDVLLGKNNLPELTHIFSELNDRLTELKTRLAPLTELFAEVGRDQI